MKKIIAAMLCVVTILCVLTGCVDKVDPGAEINIYMSYTTNFDPSVAYTDQAASELLSLVYQGLFTVDDNGKLQNAMCKKYTVTDNVIEFTLKTTRWSDGTTVTADDYVYAWKRILDPEFQSEAASLLFYIKNAEEVKNGDTSIDNLCLYAAGDSIVRVELIDSSFVDQFLYNCASVALFPLREDVVAKITIDEPYYDDFLDATTGEKILAANDVLTTYSWASLSAVLVSCGPFYVKKMDLYPSSGNPTITLERNKYYYRDVSETGDDALQKYVTPYRLVIELVSPEEAYEAYVNGTAVESNGEPILYNGNIALANRTSSDNVRDLMATYSYFFNTENPLFEKAEVRSALAAVLDREAIANLVVYGKAATGLLTDSVFYTTRKTSFREVAGTTVGASMTIEEAKAAILAAGGSTSGSFTIKVRDNDAEKAVAEYIAGIWGQIGYQVSVETLGYRSTRYYEVAGVKESGFDVQSVYEGLTRDLYLEAYQAGNFDVIGVQYSMLSTDAFAALAPFASSYSGNAYDFSESSDVFEKVSHITGYQSDAYDELMNQYLQTTDIEQRAAILVEAEKLLLSDAPITPLYFMQTGSLSTSRLKGVTYGYNGYVSFTKASDTEYTYVVEEAMIPTKLWIFG